MILFGAAALWTLWGPRRDDWLAARGAAFMLLAFFVPLFPAALFPTASVYASAGVAEEGGIPPNILFAGTMIVLALAGYALARRPEVLEGREAADLRRPVEVDQT